MDMQTVKRPTLILDKFGKRKRVPYETYVGAVRDETVGWEPGDPILWVERGEDMYALMASAYYGKVVAVVRRDDWLRAPEVDW